MKPVSCLVSIDPAGVGPAGVAVRLLPPAGTTLNTDALTYPDFTYQGPLFNTVFLDDLSVFLFKNLLPGTRAQVVCEDSVYRSYSVARHIGRGIGCVQSVLMCLGWAEPKDTVMVAPALWRKQLGKNLPKCRLELKARACDYVLQRYGQEVDSDLAEAVTLNDYFVTYRGGEL